MKMINIKKNKLSFDYFILFFLYIIVDFFFYTILSVYILNNTLSKK